MSAYHFKAFNPISGEVPYHPFSHLPTIAWRARALLESHTAEQVGVAAQNIECAIDEYFSTLKRKEIDRLRREATTLDEPGIVPEWLPNDDDLDVPTASDTSEVDALKACVDDWGKDFVDEKPFVLFAVLALSLLAEALSWLHNGSVTESTDQLDTLFDAAMREIRLEQLKTNTNLSIAGSCALKAMDAVCHAEHLRDVEIVEEKYATKLKASELVDATRKEAQTKLIKALNDARHRKRNEAVEAVKKEWEKDPSKFLSAEKAGLYFSDWLSNRGFEYEPRTVTGWIRAHAKEKGVRFR